MIITSIPHLRKVVASLIKRDIKWFTLDSETVPKPQWAGDKVSTLIHPRMDINIFSFCYKGEAYSVPTSVFNVKYPTIHEIMVVMAKLFDHLKANKRPVVMHNANYDIRVFQGAGYDLLRLLFWDTAIGAWMSNGNEDKSLKARAPLYERYQVDTKTINFTDIDALAEYAEQDVVVTDEIYQMQTFGVVIRPKKLVHVDRKGNNLITKNSVPVHILRNIPGETLTDFDRIFLKYQELPVLRATIRAENNGICIDWKKLQGVSDAIDTELKKTQKVIYRTAGKVFNVNAPAQLGKVMHDVGVHSPLTTKSGAESWNKESLFYLAGAHPLVDHVQNYRRVAKLASTYTGPNGLSFFRNPMTKRIHCNLNTTGAVTGRFSSDKPNMQNIPARADTFGIRDTFVAPKGKTLICLDFSQIELRIMAQLSQDPVMMKVLNDPKGDIHQASADGFHVPRDPVAKQCNFLLIFGGGAYVLSKGLTLAGAPTDEETAQTYIDGFDSLYVRPKEWRGEMLAFHRENGFVPLLSGRRRIIEGADSTNKWKLHKAETQMANNIVQGSAQDQIKAAIVRNDFRCINPDAAILRNMDVSRSHALKLRDMSKRLEKLRKIYRLAKLEWHLQVHDEVLYSVDTCAAQEVAHYIAEVMGWPMYWEPIMDLNVVIRADGGIGDTWKSAKKPKLDSCKVHPTYAPFGWALR